VFYVDPNPKSLALTPITNPIWCDSVGPFDRVPVRFAVTDFTRT